MAVTSNTLVAGFDNPVQHSQQVFRAVLKAMSEPGHIATLSNSLNCPKGLQQSAWQLALSLFDSDTKLWLSPRLAASESLVSNLRFHCQSRIVSNPADADMALCDSDEIPLLADLNWGCAEYPDQSCTLIVQVAAISQEPYWQLSGAGIETTRPLRIANLPEHFRTDLINSRKRFPLGIDAVFCCGESLVALPRSTQIKQEHDACM